MNRTEHSRRRTAGEGTHRACSWAAGSASRAEGVRGGRQERCRSVGECSQSAVNPPSCLCCPDLTEVRCSSSPSGTGVCGSALWEGPAGRCSQGRSRAGRRDLEVRRAVRPRFRAVLDLHQMQVSILNAYCVLNALLGLVGVGKFMSQPSSGMSEETDNVVAAKVIDEHLQKVNDSYSKHFSLGANLQNVAESQDEDFMEKVIFTDLLEVKAAEYEDDQEQIKKQQANIFVPSSSPVNSQHKLPKGMIPRILEDEGFYIQRKPKIYKKTCNKMENRLLKLEKGNCWFEESGELMSLPTPIKQSWSSSLNISKEFLNPALKTTYRKTKVSSEEGLSFFILNGEEGSALDQSSEQKAAFRLHSTVSSTTF
ncbi:PREDICTED: uncharacterized protein C10orf131 homolog [Propithecus coquereli]|uniref:uncharacterized protein C10orf131 homolog n=1 Tax=Propithecus coquereli TaxID=379532 RepID=UPI00063ED534|nr:PREDICTED: uncharacterized protein C10orf131 homolog [Propithecus coquereli]